MQWLILVGGKNFNLDTIKAVNHNGCIRCYDVPNMEGRYCVDFGRDHIFYDYSERIEEFGDEFLDIPYVEPHFITMTYTSKERVKKVLRQKDFPTDIYVDNDYGVFLPISKFIQAGIPIGKEESKMKD